MNRLAVLEAFTVLDSTYKRRWARGKPAVWDPPLDIWWLHQCEIFKLAQAVGALYFPALQTDLDSTRARVVKIIRTEIKRKEAAIPSWQVDYSVFAPTTTKAIGNRWTTIEITPEISLNPQLSGVTVPRREANELKALHRQQISQLESYAAAFSRKRRQPA